LFPSDESVAGWKIQGPLFPEATHPGPRSDRRNPPYCLWHPSPENASLPASSFRPIPISDAAPLQESVHERSSPAAVVAPPVPVAGGPVPPSISEISRCVAEKQP